MIDIEHLIVSNTRDFSSDLVTIALERAGARYFRLNKDQLSDFDIDFDLSNGQIIINTDSSTSFCVSCDTIKSIYFRAPTFLRNSKGSYSVSEQLHRSQWSAFLRNLTYFEDAKWVNNPAKTFRAENKLLQLKIAKRVGLAIPKTKVVNFTPNGLDSVKNYIVKSLDTALFYEDSDKIFSYTSVVNGQEIMESQLHLSPLVIQEQLTPKIDIRVTIIGQMVFSSKIITQDSLICGDWRLMPRDSLQYIPIEIPDKVKYALLQLMEILQLEFGGIDLIYCRDTYYFIEINPTGEWGWLESLFNPPISEAIAACLLGVELLL
jgi:uncharacterized protein YegP (UPF0339 family)